MPESKRRKPKKTNHPAAAVPAKAKLPSPRWYVVTMAALMVVGVVAVIARFVFELDQYVTIGGLVLIAAGFFMTTNYR
mgnify:CR=1 FL=1